MSFGAVILAGGQSRRMGKNKAALEIGGQTLLDRQVELVRAAGAAEIWISASRGTDLGAPGVPVLLDSVEGHGPLAGVVTALRCATVFPLLVLAVDVPFVTESFLEKLRKLCTPDRGVVPAYSWYLEPLVAFYPRAVSPLAERRLLAGELRLQELVREALARRLMNPYPLQHDERRMMENWNTPMDANLPGRPWRVRLPCHDLERRPSIW